MKKYIIRKVNKELGESFCETRTFKKIVKRNELYTFKNTFSSSAISFKNSLVFKKIRTRVNNINNYISKLKEKFGSLSYELITKSKSFFNTLEKDFPLLINPKKDDFGYISEYYEIPQKYNETSIRVLAQNPKKLFVYWEISDNDISKYLDEYGDIFYTNTTPLLILENKEKNHKFEIGIDGYANSWYIDIVDDSSTYSVTYARKVSSDILSSTTGNILAKGNILEFAKSNNVISPNGHILYNNSNNILFKNVSTNDEYTIPLVSVLKSSNNIYSNITGFKEEILENEHISSNMGNEF